MPLDRTERPAIRVEGLSKRYGRTLALDAMSFEVGNQELFALLGPNGAGKTTLLHILSTILRPDAGTAELGGVDVLKKPMQARRHLGYVGIDLVADLRGPLLGGRRPVVTHAAKQRLDAVGSELDEAFERWQLLEEIAST